MFCHAVVLFIGPLSPFSSSFLPTLCCVLIASWAGFNMNTAHTTSTMWEDISSFPRRFFHSCILQPNNSSISFSVRFHTSQCGGYFVGLEKKTLYMHKTQTEKMI